MNSQNKQPRWVIELMKGKKPIFSFCWLIGHNKMCIDTVSTTGEEYETVEYCTRCNKEF